ncbi:hypothetical protein PHSC3_001685 [Chlamydiales bacterium STE3]|nr:hypothetical protein PHSC3_001685 [Chlamydiales bacterium STE3]
MVNIHGFSESQFESLRSKTKKEFPNVVARSLANAKVLGNRIIHFFRKCEWVTDKKLANWAITEFESIDPNNTNPAYRERVLRIKSLCVKVLLIEAKENPALLVRYINVNEKIFPAGASPVSSAPQNGYVPHDIEEYDHSEGSFSSEDSDSSNRDTEESDEGRSSSDDEPAIFTPNQNRRNFLAGSYSTSISGVDDVKVPSLPEKPQQPSLDELPSTQTRIEEEDRFEGKGSARDSDTNETDSDGSDEERESPLSRREKRNRSAKKEDLDNGDRVSADPVGSALIVPKNTFFEELMGEAWPKAASPAFDSFDHEQLNQFLLHVLQLSDISSSSLSHEELNRWTDLRRFVLTKVKFEDALVFLNENSEFEGVFRDLYPEYSDLMHSRNAVPSELRIAYGERRTSTGDVEPAEAQDEPPLGLIVPTGEEEPTFPPSTAPSVKIMSSSGDLLGFEALMPVTETPLSPVNPRASASSIKGKEKVGEEDTDVTDSPGRQEEIRGSLVVGLPAGVSEDIVIGEIQNMVQKLIIIASEGKINLKEVSSLYENLTERLRFYVSLNHITSDKSEPLIDELGKAYDILTISLMMNRSEAEINLLEDLQKIVWDAIQHFQLSSWNELNPSSSLTYLDAISDEVSSNESLWKKAMAFVAGLTSAFIDGVKRLGGAPAVIEFLKSLRNVNEFDNAKANRIKAAKYERLLTTLHESLDNLNQEEWKIKRSGKNVLVLEYLANIRKSAEVIDLTDSSLPYLTNIRDAYELEALKYLRDAIQLCENPTAHIDDNLRKFTYRVAYCLYTKNDMSYASESLLNMLKSHSGVGSSETDSQERGNAAIPPVISRLRHTLHSVKTAPKEFKTSDVNRILKSIKDHFDYEFSPIAAGNPPQIMGSLVFGGETHEGANTQSIKIIGMGSPTIQRSADALFSNKAEIDPIFRAYLYTLEDEKKSHLYVNVQDSRDTSREKLRSHPIMAIQNDPTFENSFFSIALSKNSPFYHGVGPESLEDYKQELHNQFFKHSVEQSGCFLPQKVQIRIQEKTGIPLSTTSNEIIGSIARLYLKDRLTITKEERKFFVELYYNVLTMHICVNLEVNAINFTCKDGIDRGMGALTWFVFMMMVMNNSEGSEESFEKLEMMLNTRAYWVRKRAIIEERGERFFDDATHLMKHSDCRESCKELVRGVLPNVNSFGVLSASVSQDS